MANSCDEIDDDDVGAVSGKVVRLVGVRAHGRRSTKQGRSVADSVGRQ